MFVRTAAKHNTESQPVVVFAVLMNVFIHPERFNILSEQKQKHQTISERFCATDQLKVVIESFLFIYF